MPCVGSIKWLWPPFCRPLLFFAPLHFIPFLNSHCRCISTSHSFLPLTTPVLLAQHDVSLWTYRLFYICSCTVVILIPNLILLVCPVVYVTAGEMLNRTSVVSSCVAQCTESKSTNGGVMVRIAVCLLLGSLEFCYAAHDVVQSWTYITFMFNIYRKITFVSARSVTIQQATQLHLHVL